MLHLKEKVASAAFSFCTLYSSLFTFTLLSVPLRDFSSEERKEKSIVKTICIVLLFYNTLKGSSDAVDIIRGTGQIHEITVNCR